MLNRPDMLPDEELDRSQIMDKYWLEFLQWIKNTPTNQPNENNFWIWYIKFKMEAN